MGLLGALFGGGKQKSQSTSSGESGNRAFEFLMEALGPSLGVGTNALSSMSEQLGSFDDYKRNSGFDFAYNKGTRDIAGGAAARGLLNSGSTAKALAKYEGDLGSMYYGNYLDRLGDVSKLGLGAGELISGAGNYSTQESQSTGSGKDYGKGILGTLFG